MAQHRCTRCKQDVGQYGIRHKYVGGLFCESCLRELRQGSRVIRNEGFFGFVSSIWDTLKRIHQVVFRPKTKTVSFSETSRVAYKTMNLKARNIPHDARATVPQKR